MADATKIEWSEATWNPITGCTVHSAGCTNCYAMKLAGTRLQNHPSRAGLTMATKAGPVWTGEVRFNRGWLNQPVQWAKPRMIFVCAHADLFHKDVPTEWIDEIFDIMETATQHTYQVLTKRSDRMREYLVERYTNRFPPPNIWIGVSVENQAAADERIPDLLRTPAAVRWVSMEPLLEQVQLTNINGANSKAPAVYWVNALSGEHDDMCRPCAPLPKLDWIVIGGESGTGARRFELEWMGYTIAQCKIYEVPVFAKQLGKKLNPKDYKDFEKWPKGLRVRQWPEAA